MKSWFSVGSKWIGVRFGFVLARVESWKWTGDSSLSYLTEFGVPEAEVTGRYIHPETSPSLNQRLADYYAAKQAQERATQRWRQEWAADDTVPPQPTLEPESCVRGTSAPRDGDSDSDFDDDEYAPRDGRKYTL